MPPTTSPDMHMKVHVKNMRSVVSHPLDELTGDEVRISYPPCSRERRLLTLPTLTHVADSVWGGADGSQISDISLAVRKYGVAKGIKAFKFITAGLVPPAKEKVLAYLGIGISPGQAPSNPPGQLGRHGEIDVGFLFDPYSSTYLRDLSVSISLSTWSRGTWA